MSDGIAMVKMLLGLPGMMIALTEIPQLCSSSSGEIHLSVIT